MAFNVLPDNKLLHQEQVALLLECKTRWLEEQRSQGHPPPYVQLGDRMVRYAVGSLRSWLNAVIAGAPTSPTAKRKQVDAAVLGFDEPILRGGRRAKPLPHPTFGLFVASGKATSEWPFVLTAPYGRPINFIDALALELPGDDPCAWLTLVDYGERLATSARHEEAEKGSHDVAASMNGATVSNHERNSL